MEVLSFPCSVSTPTAIALGRFDGVHTGHKKVISAAASAQGLTPAVFTFCDNPGKSEHKLLSTEEEKLELIEACGIKILVNSTFEAVRGMSAQEFFTNVLVEKLNAKALFCGYNYRFGKGASADVNTLKSLCDSHGIALVCTEEISADFTAVSSTAIRNLLSCGEVEKANTLLGRNYSLSGRIVHGNAIGRTIETPTLNIDVDKSKLLPLFGVYATKAFVGDRVFDSVTNIGIKPTIGSDSPTIETYLLDFIGDFYGDDCTIELVGFIRPEVKFTDLSTLKEQITKDIEKAKQILKYRCKKTS